MIALVKIQEGRRVKLSLTDAKKVEENVDGIEFLVPRNQNQSTVVRNFLSSNFAVNGDYPLLDQVQKKKLIHGRFINQNDIGGPHQICIFPLQRFNKFIIKAIK